MTKQGLERPGRYIVGPEGPRSRYALERAYNSTCDKILVPSAKQKRGGEVEVGRMEVSNEGATR